MTDSLQSTATNRSSSTATQVLETGWGNLFAVTGRTIRTPATDGRILPGTVRAWVLRAAPSLGLVVEEGALGRDELAAADEVFVTSAIRGVQPVASCIGIGSWSTGSATRRLAEAWTAHVERTVARHRGWVDRARDPWPPRGPLGPGRLVVVDNYDSFTFNLVHHLGELGADPVIVRNDEVTAAEVIAARPRGIVLSPGPAGPDDAGICVELIETIDPTTPLLGVCLGSPMHGSGLRRRGGPGARGGPRQGLRGAPRRPGRLPRTCPTPWWPPAITR